MTETVGFAEGAPVGEWDGSLLGARLGSRVGEEEGSQLGSRVGDITLMIRSKANIK
jgi:hypothetical protein